MAHLRIAGLSAFAVIVGGILSMGAGESAEQKMTVKDNLSRMVEIPKNVDRILSIQPEITRIIVALGAGDRLVGVDYFIRRNDHLFKIIFPEESKLPVVSKPDDSVNLEYVVRLNPDVIFASPSEFFVPETIQRNLKIPVLALASLGRFDRLLEEIEIVGRATGLEERAGELTAYFREKLKAVSAAVTAVPVGKKPKVYLAFWSSLLRTPVFYEPVNVAGGTNLAEGLVPSHLGTDSTIVTLEQIIRWDPDIILIQGNFLPQERMVTVAQVLGDNRLGSVRAIKKKRVHYTFGFWYWWDPAEVLLETLYLAKLFYPDQFGQLDLEKEGNEIFKMFYRKDGAFTALAEAVKFDDWTNW